MKRITALILAFVLVFTAAACTKKQPSETEPTVTEDTKNTDKGTSSEPTSSETEKPTETETETEPTLSDEQKQAYYEDLFRHPSKIAYAGESTLLLSESAEGSTEARYEHAGNDQMIRMAVPEKNVAYALITVDEKFYLYVSMPGPDGEKVEKLLRSTDGKPEGMDEDADFTLSDEDAYESVTYIGTEDGFDVVEAQSGDEEEPLTYAYFDQDGRLVKMVADTEEEGRMEVTFYHADRIEIPDLPAEDSTREEIGWAMFAALASMMSDGDPTDPSAGPTDDPYTDPTDDPYTDPTDDPYTDPTEPQLISVDEGYEDDRIAVRIGKISYDANWEAYEVELELENKTDRGLTYSDDGIFVNGCQIDSYVYENLMPGEKETASFVLDDADLELAGITNIEKIVLILDVYYAGWTDDPFEIDLQITSYFGTTAEEYQDPPRYLTENGQVVAEKDGAAAAVTFVGYKEDGRYAVWFMMENGTDEELCYVFTDFKINDEHVSIAGFRKWLLPHTKMYVQSYAPLSELTRGGKEFSGAEKLTFHLQAGKDMFLSDTDPVLFIDDVVTWTAK